MSRLEAQVMAELALRLIVEGQMPTGRKSDFRKALKVLDTPTVDEMVGVLVRLGKIPDHDKFEREMISRK